MGSAISIKSGLSQHVYMALQITETATDQTANTSILNWALVGWLEAAQSAYWYSQTYHAINVTINGQTVYTRAATTAQTIGIGTTHASEATAYKIAEGSLTVAHDSDGTKTISASFSCAYRWNGGSWSGSGSLALTPVARASSVSCDTLTMGTAGTITISKANSSFTHTLIFDWGDATSSGISAGRGYSDTIVSKTSASTVSWTPPLKYASIIPNASQGQGTLRCQTFNSSGTKIGEKSIVVTILVPGSTAPTLSIAVSRVRTTNTGITGYIQDIDSAKVTLTAKGQYGAYITSYSSTVGGVGYSGSAFTTNTLGTAGTITIKSTVTDSKGYSTTATKSISVTAYSKPSITAVSAYRCAGADDPTADESGEYICVKPTGSITALSNKNTFKCTVYYKKSTAINWDNSTTITDSGADYKLNGEYCIFSAATTASWDVKVTLTDAFNSTSYVAKQVSTIGTFISILKSGPEKVAMGIGKLADMAKRFYLGWGLVVEAGSNRDTDGADIFVKNTPVTGVRVQETTNNYGLGMFVDDAKNRGLWDLGTNNWLICKDSADKLHIPSEVDINSSASISGQLSLGSTSKSSALEIYAGTPYIDFHYSNSSADYTARIIENSKGVLTALNSITSGSDERLKEDITDIDDVYMELVERLQAKTFHMKLMDDGALSCGFIAQDVLAIEKELGIEHSVLVRNSGEETITPAGDKIIAYYSIDYQAYAVLLGEYYRRKLDNLSARVDALESTKS